MRWVWLFLISAGALTAQLALHRELLPYTGTLATAALLGLAVEKGGAVGSWPGRAGLAGLATLTLAAGVIDADGGGYGWPTEVGRHAGVLAVVLLTAAAAMLGVAVLGAAAAGLRQRRLWPAAVVGLAGLAWYANTSPAYYVGLPVVALLLVLVATNAALASDRGYGLAGAGLLAVLALAGTAVGAAADLTEPDRTVTCGRLPAGHTDTVVFLAVCDSAAQVSGNEVSIGQADPALIREAEERIRLSRPGLSATMVAVVPAQPADLTKDPISWSLDPWQGGLDWDAVRPAAHGALYLLGLAALVMSLYRVRPR
ncbi:hypothetical protein [Paractinoplanes durhamensis]|uniref:Uncharacterized protein n=1 Tax=Paractinoplanes durhamensis TaxID=113563 RepID=A0ABQ3ZDP2_9ACTN|nr:hypothetical protein [Actinoplanes durhamensis]GIE07959.1 hypothetical protein Adu01nite_93090 [Actinoplanes durhamensis]